MNLARLLGMGNNVVVSRTLVKAPVRLEAKIEIWPAGQVIRLEGELGILTAALQCEEIQKILKSALPSRSITIDAAQVTLDPEDVQQWVAFVEEFFRDWRLSYRASQLTEILRYHEGYDHPFSELQALDAEEPRETAHIEFAVFNRKDLSETLALGAKRHCVGTENVMLDLSQHHHAACAL